MPPLKKYIEREEGDPESDDEDIEMQGGQESLKDPITMRWLEKPVRQYVLFMTYQQLGTDFRDLAMHANMPILESLSLASSVLLAKYNVQLPDAARSFI
jgi:hypothetical protein